MGGFYLHAFKITAGLGYLVFKLNQQCQQASELIRLQMCKFLGSVVQQVSFKMQIKFCDNICGVCQGPILGPILFNTSISGTEHTLSKLAGSIMLSSAVGITEGRDGSEGQWQAGGMCSWEPPRARSCTWVGAMPNIRAGWVMNKCIENSPAEKELEILVDEKFDIIFWQRWQLSYHHVTECQSSQLTKLSPLDIQRNVIPTFPSVLYSF